MHGPSVGQENIQKVQSVLSEAMNELSYLSVDLRLLHPGTPRHEVFDSVWPAVPQLKHRQLSFTLEFRKGMLKPFLLLRSSLTRCTNLISSMESGEFWHNNKESPFDPKPDPTQTVSYLETVVSDSSEMTPKLGRVVVSLALALSYRHHSSAVLLAAFLQKETQTTYQHFLSCFEENVTLTEGATGNSTQLAIGMSSCKRVLEINEDFSSDAHILEDQEAAL